MPAERVAMRQVREIIRLKFSAGISTREIARRLGIAASTVRETLRRFEGAGLGWPLPDRMRDGDLEAALYNHGTKRGHRRHAEPDWPTVHRELKRKHVTLLIGRGARQWPRTPAAPASVQAWLHSASGSTRWSTDTSPRVASASTEVNASARCSGERSSSSS